MSLSFSSSWNPSKEVCENKSVPSVVSMSLDYQEEDLALKSTVITDKYGLGFFISITGFSRLDKNESNSSLFWLGER